MGVSPLIWWTGYCYRLLHSLHNIHQQAGSHLIQNWWIHTHRFSCSLCPSLVFPLHGKCVISSGISQSLCLHGLGYPHSCQVLYSNILILWMVNGNIRWFYSNLVTVLSAIQCSAWKRRSQIFIWSCLLTPDFSKLLWVRRISWSVVFTFPYRFCG